MRPLILLICLSLATPLAAQSGGGEPPHLALQGLMGQLSKLGSSRLIRPAIAVELEKPLARCLRSLQQARPARAMRHLDVFGRKVRAQLPADLGRPLSMQARRIRDQIDILAGRTLSASVEQCVVPGPREFRSIRLGGAKGTSSIPEALSLAAARGWDAVEILLPAGIYTDGLIEIDRHTRIVAPGGAATIRGRIVNQGPYLLELENILLSRPNGTGIYVDHPCAVTRLTGVEVRRAGGTGIWQRGGFLSADRLTVDQSAAPAASPAADPHEGRGLRLSDGVQACLSRAGLDRNGAGALLAEGLSTRVYAGFLSARDNEVSPTVLDELFSSPGTPSGVGDVEVRGDALFLGEWLYAGNSGYAGVVVNDHGRAHVRYSLFERARQREDGFRVGGGISLGAVSGDLEASAVEARLATWGLRTNPATGGWVRGTALRVTDNELAYGLFTTSSAETTCALRCLDGRLLRNGRNVSANFLPIPTDPTEPPPVCPPCPVVEFRPSWCTE